MPALIFVVVLVAGWMLLGAVYGAAMWVFGHPVVMALGVSAVGAVAMVISREVSGDWRMLPAASAIAVGPLRTSLRGWALGSTLMLACALALYGGVRFQGGTGKRVQSVSSQVPAPAATRTGPARPGLPAVQTPANQIAPGVTVPAQESRTLVATTVSSSEDGYEDKLAAGTKVFVEEVREHRCFIQSDQWVPCAALEKPAAGWASPHPELTAGVATARDHARIVVRPGGTLEDWSLGADGILRFGGEVLLKAGDPPGDELRVSKGSPSGNYRYVVFVDIDKGAFHAWIWRPGAALIIPLRRMSGSRQFGVFDQGIAWSPDERYAIVTESFEVQEHALLIDLVGNRQTLHSIGPFPAGDCEIQWLSGRPARWLESGRFRLRVKVENNPWGGGPNCQPRHRLVLVDLDVTGSGLASQKVTATQIRQEPRAVGVEPATPATPSAATSSSTQIKPPGEVVCILPSGQEARVVLADCRARGGLVYE